MKGECRPEQNAPCSRGTAAPPAANEHEVRLHSTPKFRQSDPNRGASTAAPSLHGISMIKSAIFVFLAVCCLGAAQANATLIGGNLQSDTSTSAIAKAQIANGKIDADSFNSPDLGENINSAVAVCAAAGIRCNIEVSKGGTFTTSPEVPMGFSVSFSPQGIYTLNTTFVIDHRSTTWHFNGAQFKLVMSKRQPPFMSAST